MDFFVEAIRIVPGRKNLDKTDEELLPQAEKLLNDMDRMGEKDRQITYINCWHEDSHESEAMRKLFMFLITQALRSKPPIKNFIHHSDGNFLQIEVAAVLKAWL